METKDYFALITKILVSQPAHIVAGSVIIWRLYEESFSEHSFRFYCMAIFLLSFVALLSEPKLLGFVLSGLILFISSIIIIIDLIRYRMCTHECGSWPFSPFTMVCAITAMTWSVYIILQRMY